MRVSKHKVRFFESKIGDYFASAGRDFLPWRPSRSRTTGQVEREVSAYEVWVSEIMLQQTQVSRVVGYYTRFLERFTSVEVLARASWEEFLPYYAGLGYYARGRNMLLTAQKVVAEYGGEFPRDKQHLMRLPGIGDYTASAILSFAYGDDYMAWDTNVKRVIGRFFYGTKLAFSSHSKPDTTSPRPSPVPPLKLRATRGQLRGGGSACHAQEGARYEDFEQVFLLPAKELNAALMDFGSSICMGRPKCGNCPLSAQCVYFESAGRMEQGAARVLDGVRGNEQEMQAVSSKKRGLGSRQEDDEGEAGDGERAVSWKNAQVFLWLHENHRKYYSAEKKRFAVFVVPPSHNTRAGIKDWFRVWYALELSVRPPHRKILIDGHPTLLVNAQVLSGTLTFTVFAPDVVRDYTEGMNQEQETKKSGKDAPRDREDASMQERMKAIG